MAFIGFLGFALIGGTEQAMAIMGSVPYSTVAFYPATSVPLFVLMGAIISGTGISGDLYNTAHKWFGGMRGGLAIATVIACALFAAITGTSVAGAVTMGKVALPEMKRFKYDMSMATGSIASGGTLGILIPPSLGFILYGMVTEESIGKLFMAGIIPGLLLTTIFILVVLGITLHNPAAGPPGPPSSFKEKLRSIKGTWQTAALFILVLGGIYLGIFTPTEAGAVGAMGAIIITLISRRLTRTTFVNSLLETGQLTAMIMLLVVGSFIFMRFLSLSQLPTTMTEFIGSLSLSRWIIYIFIVLFYMIVGMFLDIMSMMVLTVPFIYPVIVALGFDPIWFGVIAVIIMEMGLVTPPVGLNVFALAGVCDVPLPAIFRGVLPFVIAMLICVAILTIFPQIVMFLPNNM
jgi:tripartite ATP-independent transporter DctM subunit